ncbi:MAG: PulJ/GspJ family protein [Cellulomonas sp.]
MTRARSVRDSRDRGSTLTELLIVMMIVSMIVAVTASLTIGFQRTNAQNISRQDQIDVARSAVERVSKTVRTAVKPSQLTNCPGCLADAFLSAEALSVQFYANLNNAGNGVGPSRVTYSVATTGADAGVLLEKVQVPNPFAVGASAYVYCPAELSGASAACKATLTTRRLTPGANVSTAAPVFTYYNSQGAEMTPGAGASLGVDDLEKVLSIEIVVTVASTNATTAKPTTYIQRVTLPNSQAVLRAGSESTP